MILQNFYRMEVITVLLEFRVTNYKSFKDELIFSLIPDFEVVVLSEKD